MLLEAVALGEPAHNLEKAIGTADRALNDPAAFEWDESLGRGDVRRPDGDTGAGRHLAGEDERRRPAEGPGELIAVPCMDHGGAPRGGRVYGDIADGAGGGGAHGSGKGFAGGAQGDAAGAGEEQDGRRQRAPE